MELWIRSQDKEDLLKVSYVSIRHIFEQKEVMDNYGRIVNFKKGDYKHSTISNGNIDLGYYKTKERALEVLDEIQNILKPRNLIYTGDKINMKDAMHLCKMTNSQSISLLPENANVTQLGVVIYEMPKE